MSVADLYRNRGVNPLAVQGGSMRLPSDANTVNLWNFREGHGNVQDYGSDGVLGIAAAMTWTLNGPFGSALAMNNSSDGTGIAMAGLTALTGAQSAELVFRCLSGIPADALLMVRGEGYGAMTMDMVTGSSGTTLYARAKSGITDYSTDYINLSSLGAWQYLAFTYTPSTSIILYLNGSAANTKTASIPASVNSNTTAYYGRRNTEGQYPGLFEFAQIRHSNIARTAAEILANARCMGFA